MDISALRMALTFRGISGAAVAIDRERGAVVVEWVERGAHRSREFTFDDIEAWCRENLPAMPAEIASE